jgi:hypothetical protein
LTLQTINQVQLDSYVPKINIFNGERGKENDTFLKNGNTKKHFKHFSSFLWQRKFRMLRKMRRTVKKTVAVRVKEKAARMSVTRALTNVKMGHECHCCSLKLHVFSLEYTLQI